MAYGFDIATGLTPRSNNPFGNNRMLDWTQVAPGFSPDIEGGMALQPAPATYPALPPLPIPGMPRQQMAFAQGPATPVIAPKVQAQEQPKQEDIGNWDPNKPFELPDSGWKVKSFVPGEKVQVEKPGVQGTYTISPGQNLYQKIEDRYKNLVTQYQQLRPQPATPEGQVVTQQPMVNIGGEKRVVRFSPEDKSLYIDYGPDIGELKYNDWTNIPEKDFTFPLDPQTGKPVNTGYQQLRQSLGSNLRDQSTNLNQFLNMDYKSAPTQSLMLKDLKYRVTGGEDDSTPSFEFYWDGAGPAPKGLVERANQNIKNMIDQAESYSKEYDRVVSMQGTGIVDKFIAEKNQEIAGYESQKQAAQDQLNAANSTGDKKAITSAKQTLGSIETKINRATSLRDKAESTRIINVDGGTIVEELPSKFAAQVNPKSWMGKLALASGLGYRNKQEKQDEAQPVLDNDKFARIAAADAILDTEIAPVGVNVSEFRKTLAPTIERLGLINSAGLDEYGANWDDMVQSQPATFQYTDVYGQKKTVSMPIPQATANLNEALKKTFDAISVGDEGSYQAAIQEVRKASELFSGSITPPGGLETVLPTKSELRMANLGGSFSYVNEDKALIPGTLSFGAMNREVSPPRMMYNPPPRPTGGGRDKRFVPALPVFKQGTSATKLNGQSISSIATTPGVYEAIASETDPSRAQLFGQRLLGTMALKPGGADITEQDAKNIGGLIDELNVQAADPAKGKDLREMASNVVWQQLKDVGIPLGTQAQFVQDMSGVYSGTMTPEGFMEKYWSKDRGLSPTSDIGWQAWRTYVGSVVGREMAAKASQGPQYKSLDTSRKGNGEPFDVVWESARNKIMDTAYLMRNLGKVSRNEQGGGYAHQVDASQAGRDQTKIQMFVNPFSDENAQSPFTAMVSVNNDTALPLLGTQEQAKALANGKSPGINEQYDVTGSILLMNTPGYAGMYMPAIQRYLSNNPISDRINTVAGSYWSTDMRALDPVRKEEDENTVYDNQSQRQIPVNFIEGAIWSSMFPKNRILARTK